MNLPLLALSALALAASAPASAAPAAAGGAAPPCFRVSNVTGFQPVKDREDRLRLTVIVSDVYELEFMGTCPGVDVATQIAIVSRTGGSRICEARDAAAVVSYVGHGGQECLVSKLRLVSREERAAEAAAEKAARAAKAR